MYFNFLDPSEMISLGKTSSFSSLDNQPYEVMLFLNKSSVPGKQPRIQGGGTKITTLIHWWYIADLNNTYNKCLINIMMHDDLMRLVQAARLSERYPVIIHPSMRRALLRVSSAQ